MQKLAAAHQLRGRLVTVLDTVEREFNQLSDKQMRWKPAPGRWSIVECLQHLNLAEQVYIRAIRHTLDQRGMHPAQPTDQTLHSDWIGRAMLYALDPQVSLKIPAPGMIRPGPPGDLNTTAVMQQFVDLQTLLHDSVNDTLYLDWNRVKVQTLFSDWPGLGWLKIRLGDAFRMLVAHTERHVNQAMRVKEALSLVEN